MNSIRQRATNLISDAIKRTEGRPDHERTAALIKAHGHAPIELTDRCWFEEVNSQLNPKEVQAPTNNGQGDLFALEESP